MPTHKSYTLSDGIYLSESAAKKLTDDTKLWAERKPIGIRFNPSDRALAMIALRSPGNFVLSFVREIKVYDYEPWNLSVFAHEFGEGKMYFFTRRQKKYRKGKNIDRTVREGGFWRKTGSDSTIEVTDDSIGKRIVRKTSLALYNIDEKPGEKKKKQWLMKEYMVETKSDENPAMQSDDLDPLVLCVVYSNDDGKPGQHRESGTSSESFDDRSKRRRMPNGVAGPSHVFDSFTASNSLLPPIPIRNYPQPPSICFAEYDNPSHFPIPISRLHEIFSVKFSKNLLRPSSSPGITTPQQGLFPSSEQNMIMGSQDNFSNNQLYPSSSPGMITPQQGLTILPSSEQNMMMEPQANFINNQPYSSSNPGITHQQGLSIFPNSKQNMMMGSQDTTCQSSFFNPVSGTCFQQIQDSGQSLNSFVNNLANQEPDFMVHQLEQDPCEDPSAAVRSSSNIVKNTNFWDQNGNLSHNMDLIMDRNSLLQSSNEHGANQQQQPNSHSLSDQITEQQPSDSAMPGNPIQQNPPGITVSNLQPSEDYDSPDEFILNEFDPTEFETLWAKV